MMTRTGNIIPAKTENNIKSIYGYWRMNIPVGAKSVIVPSYMLGKEIWLNDKKIKVTDSLINLAPESKLLSFVINRKEEKITSCSFLNLQLVRKRIKNWLPGTLMDFSNIPDF